MQQKSSIKCQNRGVTTITVVVGMLTAIVISIVGVAPAHAAKKTKQTDSDRALLVNQSNRFLVLPPGKSVTVWFDFQNVGTSTWTSQDPHPVALNTDDPIRRQSKFEFKRWRAYWRPTRLSQKTVKPGEIGRFRFALKAPKKSGIWRERFVVVRDTATKIQGGEAEFVIVVGNQADPATIYHAKPKNPTLSLWVRPGERIYRPLGFRNIGYATWRKEGFGTTTLVPIPSEQPHASNVASLAVNATPTITAEAGRAKTTTAILDVTAPATSGTVEETFGLYGPFGVIHGSQVTVQLTVSEEPQPPLNSEPKVRIGVFAPTKPVLVTANGTYEIRNAASGELLSTETTDAVSTVTYDPATGTYNLTTPTVTTSVSVTLRFLPTTAETIMEIKSFSNRRVINVDGTEVTVNDNRFRGVIEIRYAASTKKLWVINELLVEDYLRGLAETSNKPHTEFTKALITAARTYALFHGFYGRKHAAESYHINSTTDQLYRGYNYELRTPNISAAVEATRGIVITHPSEVSEKNIIGVIVAAYSSCTDGRTRSYYERWGGSPDAYPYLVSVPDPNGICTNTRWLKGLDGNHMVGMSASGALATSLKDGLMYDALLKYYYTGVSIIRAYL